MNLGIIAAGVAIPEPDIPPPGPFSPLDLSPVLWLDASDGNTLYDATTGGSLVTTEDAAVARWEDKSGNARHAIQATAGARPVLKLAAQNSLSVLRWNGSKSLAAAYGTTIAQPVTIFSIASMESGTYDFVYDGVDVGARQSLYRDIAISQFALFANATLGDLQAVTSAYRLYSLVFNGGSSRIYRGGDLKNTGAGGAHSAAGMRVGSNYNDSGNRHVGNIGEIIVAPGNLDDATREETEAYLATKWGLALE